MHTTEPDYQLNALDAHDSWVACPQCHYPMLKLREYRISDASDAPALEGDTMDYLLFGYAIYLWGIVVRYLFGSIVLVYRKLRLDKLKSEILPAHPHSLVCPKCLNILRQR